MPIAISVVVATRNRAELLGTLLEALAQQSLEASQFEVIVIDDRSTDQTAETIGAWEQSGRLQLRTLQTPENAGPAIARQLGVEASTGPFVAFTDDDCRPTPGWLEAGLQRCRDSPGRFIQGRTEPDPRDGTPFIGMTHTVEITELDPSFQTCNIFYPREALESVGGFDTSGRLVPGEDADLGWRVKAAGWYPLFEPDALTHHAVHQLSPRQYLRNAAGWGGEAVALDRHPGLRAQLLKHGFFLKRIHTWLAIGIASLVLPRRLWPFQLLAWRQYLRSALSRSRSSGGGPTLIPLFLVHDLLEMLSLMWGGIRRGRLFL